MRPLRVHTSQRLAVGRELDLEPGPARHLVRVLRKRAGDTLWLFNGAGRDYEAEILHTGPRDACRVKLHKGHRVETESPLGVTLVQAVGKGDKMDWCIQKSVELGVKAINPVLTERTEVRLSGDRAGKRVTRWQEIVISACEQCGRAVVPKVAPVKELFELRPGPGTRLFLHPDGDLSLCGLTAPSDGQICLAVGPEGGFSPGECEWLGRQGFAGLALGRRILRTETAGPTAIAVLQARFGDLG